MIMSSMLQVYSKDASYAYGSAIVSIGEQNEVMNQKLNTLLSKQTQLENKLKTEKGIGEKRKAAAGQIGKIFAAIRYAQSGYDGAALLTSAEILGDLLSLTEFLPGFGTLISQIASKFISLYYDPSEGSIIKDALENQYFQELENEGLGIYDVIDRIRVDIEHLDSVVSNDKLLWDQGADDTLNSVHTGTRYTEITIYMGKFQKAIIDKIESTRHGPPLEIIPILKQVNMYFTLTEYLEVQFIRLALLLETGLEQEPTLKRFITVISKMRDNWIPDLHQDAKGLLKYFWEPELQNVYIVYELYQKNDGNQKTNMLRYLKRKEDQFMLKQKETALENGDIIEIWKDGKPLNSMCPPSSPLNICKAEFNGALNDIIWILEEGNYGGYQIRSATTRYNYKGVPVRWCFKYGEIYCNKKEQIVIRVKDSECGDDGKNNKNQCYAIIADPPKWQSLYDKTGLDGPLEPLALAFTIKKASTNLTLKRTDVARRVELTSKSDYCLSPCNDHGYSYQWCPILDAPPEKYDKWGYCSTSEGKSSSNKQCKNLGGNKYWCQRNHGIQPYDYCYTTDGKWDYCSIVNIDKYQKANSTQPDKYSYVGRCLGGGKASDEDTLEDQATELRCYKQCLNDARATGCEFSKTGKCVKKFKESLTAEVDGNKDYRCFVFKTRAGYCIDSNDRDVNTGDTVIAMGMTDQNCYEQCKNMENVTSCEWERKNGKCIVHTKEVAKGNGNQDYKCWVL